jgi:hypothetical protein
MWDTKEQAESSLVQMFVDMKVDDYLRLFGLVEEHYNILKRGCSGVLLEFLPWNWVKQNGRLDEICRLGNVPDRETLNKLLYSVNLIYIGAPTLSKGIEELQQAAQKSSANPGSLKGALQARDITRLAILALVVMWFIKPKKSI